MRQVGTPYCITVDFETLDDDTVTLRERDSTEQRRVSVPELLETKVENNCNRAPGFYNIDKATCTACTNVWVASKGKCYVY